MEAQPLVGVIMGSKSDWDTMRHAAEILESFGVPFEKKIVSAHRTPRLMAEYASTAEDRGLEAIIAGAGGAAHLPGMVASHTTLPVLGVPVETHALKGMDSAALHRADARRNSGGDVRHRQGGRHQRGPVRGGDPVA